MVSLGQDRHNYRLESPYNQKATKDKSEIRHSIHRDTLSITRVWVNPTSQEKAGTLARYNMLGKFHRCKPNAFLKVRIESATPGTINANCQLQVLGADGCSSRTHTSPSHNVPQQPDL